MQKEQEYKQKYTYITHIRLKHTRTYTHSYTLNTTHHTTPHTHSSIHTLTHHTPHHTTHSLIHTHTHTQHHTTPHTTHHTPHTHTHTYNHACKQESTTSTHTQGCQTWDFIPRSWEFLSLWDSSWELIFRKKARDRSWEL